MQISNRYKKIDGCKNIPEKYTSTTKVAQLFHQVFQCLQYCHLRHKKQA